MEMVKKGREVKVRITENRNDRSLEGVIRRSRRATNFSTNFLKVI